MSVIINDASLLLGRELDFIERGQVVIEKGRIKSAGKGSYNGKAIDGRGFLIMPGFINAHTSR
jgi:cytosine/adenosine deaminase-related metal-dependent hydrolase